MSSQAKAIISKDTTPEQIIQYMESLYGEVNTKVFEEIEQWGGDMYTLYFQDSSGWRKIHIHSPKFIKQDYGIEGVLVTVYSHNDGYSIVKGIANEFGGYAKEFDWDDRPFELVNEEKYFKENTEIIWKCQGKAVPLQM